MNFPHNDHVICFQQYQKYNRDKNVIKDRVITLVNTVDAVSCLWSFTLAFLLLNHFFNHLLSEGKEKKVLSLVGLNLRKISKSLGFTENTYFEGKHQISAGNVYDDTKTMYVKNNRWP